MHQSAPYASDLVCHKVSDNVATTLALLAQSVFASGVHM